ncbi:MAG: HAD family hydrolase [Lachnospiraceae bacterium]|nr:HAD family hydrolase [Lachnospiraceae bacterium]
MFQAVIFDIGHTLIEYKNPLNWSKLYHPAFEHIAEKCGYHFTEQQYEHAGSVLTKYNTRIHPREEEVSSTHIFTEILSGMDVPMEDMERVKECFYSYFRQDCAPFPEAEETLKTLSDNGIVLGTLSDVPYGMDNEYALGDLSILRKYFDYPFTSNDTGVRKPCAKGLQMLSETMQIALSDIVFVGDEEKDMICGIRAGAYPVLINRKGSVKEYGQRREIRSLTELVDLV